MTNHLLGAHQTGSVIFFLTRFSFTLFTTSFFFQRRGSETPFLFLIASSLCIFFFYFLLKARKKHHFVLHIQSKKLTLVLLLGAVLAYFILTKYFIKLTQNAFIEVPAFFLFLLLLYISYLFTRRGLSSITSISIFLFVLYLLFFFIYLIGGISLINLDFLNPVWIDISPSFFIHLVLLILSLSCPFLFVLFLPRDKIDHQEKQEKIFFSYFIFGTLSIFLELLLMELTLGSDLVALYPYPLFALVERVSSFLIFNRLFFLFTFCLLFDSTITLSLIAFSIIKLTKSLLKTTFVKRVFHPFLALQNKYHLSSK